jgi:hypothetical protein
MQTVGDVVRYCQHQCKVTRGDLNVKSHVTKKLEEALTWKLYVERLWRETTAPVRYEGRGSLT